MLRGAADDDVCSDAADVFVSVDFVAKMVEKRSAGGTFRGTATVFFCGGTLDLAMDQLPSPEPMGFGFVAAAAAGFDVPTSFLKPETRVRPF